METASLGLSLPRKDAWDKVRGTVRFTADQVEPDFLHAKLVTSPYAHAVIRSIDTSEAERMPGVKAVVTGEALAVLCGTWIQDRPILARGKVRYHGEPVAVVVAQTELEALRAAQAVRVEYEPLPVVNSIADALAPGAPLIHEDLGNYDHPKPVVYPQPGTNIADWTKIRKGDMAKGWAESEVVVEAQFTLPQSDHVALETRAVRVQIKPDGEVVVWSATQGPFIVRKVMHRYFAEPDGRITVNTPLVGGAFGGKQAVQLELIAYLASRAVQGAPVKLVNSREEDMITSPVRLGLEAKLKLGATRDGELKAAELSYYVDCGAYTDMAVVESKSIAADCSGPYRMENLWCDSFCVYTNHPFATSYRGFGHGEFTFCLERTLDKLAFALGMNPLELRLKNLLAPGDTSPTGVRITPSNAGDIRQCVARLRDLIGPDESARVEVGDHKVRAWGVSCHWKNSSTPPNAHSAAVLTFNPDGTVNLNAGSVEMGQGSKTALAQIVAEKLKMSPTRVHVTMDVNTQWSPEHWKTVASGTTLMVGQACLEAAEDAIRQLKGIAAIALRCPPEDLEVGGERVYLRDDPEFGIDFPAIVHGYEYPNGNSVGGQIIGRGSFIMRHLTALDPDTGKGHPGPGWVVGAQAVQVELDTRDCSYRILKAAAVLDAGRLVNPKLARSVVTGGICMGLSMASREAFLFGAQGQVLNANLRAYKLLRYGEHPQYLVDFVETPMVDSAYGARGLGEHGLVGAPAALANSLASAAQVDVDFLPLIPEQLWRAKKGAAVRDLVRL